MIKKIIFTISLLLAAFVTIYLISEIYISNENSKRWAITLLKLIYSEEAKYKATNGCYSPHILDESKNIPIYALAHYAIAIDDDINHPTYIFSRRNWKGKHYYEPDIPVINCIHKVNSIMTCDRFTAYVAFRTYNKAIIMSINQSGNIIKLECTQ